jgi:hypothetical protein
MPYPIKDCTKTLADFQQELVGCWRNEPFVKEDPCGGEDRPLSYNIMPLPSVPPCPLSEPNPFDPDNDGYILKNFRYTERLKFNDCDDKNTLAIAATAPNRGGLVGQNCRVVFYEQQVRFAEGPAGPENEDGPQVVHVENGAWLWLPRFVQQPGPYPSDDIDSERVTEDLEQPVDIMIAKQMAIPHGNTIHALGSFDTIDAASSDGCKRKSSPWLPGSPVIPDGPTPYPVRLMPECNKPSSPSLKSNLNACKRYSELKDTMADFQNPVPEYTRFPNRPLQQAVAIIKPDCYMHWYVTTRKSTNGNGKGEVVNIPFEQRVSEVIEYSAEYWLLFKKDEKGNIKKKYLAYTQNIPMVFKIEGVEYVFPHVTCNTVTYYADIDKGCCPTKA